MDPGDVAGGGHDAPPPPADDDGQVGEGRVVPLFDGGVEAVAIHMGDGEGEKLRVRQNTRRGAGGAPGWGRLSGGAGGEAIAAEGVHGGEGITRARGVKRGRVSRVKPWVRCWDC